MATLSLLTPAPYTTSCTAEAASGLPLPASEPEPPAGAHYLYLNVLRRVLRPNCSASGISAGRKAGCAAVLGMLLLSPGGLRRNSKAHPQTKLPR